LLVGSCLFTSSPVLVVINVVGVQRSCNAFDALRR